MSMLSDLNDKIKRLSQRIAEQFKTQQTAIASKVSTVNGVAPDENGDVAVVPSGDFVQKTGDTMTGPLNITGTSYAKIAMSNSNLDATTAPSQEVDTQIWYNDKNHVGLGTLQYIKYTDGTTRFICTHRTTADGQWHSFGQAIDASNNAYLFLVSAPKIQFGNGAQIWVA